MGLGLTFRAETCPRLMMWAHRYSDQPHLPQPYHHFSSPHICNCGRKQVLATRFWLHGAHVGKCPLPSHPLLNTPTPTIWRHPHMIPFTACQNGATPALFLFHHPPTYWHHQQHRPVRHPSMTEPEAWWLTFSYFFIFLYFFFVLASGDG